MRRATLTCALGFLLAASSACGPATPPPKPVEEPEPPPPPPPPPKCEEMSEKCRAKRSTVARIPNVSYGFTPPTGAIYAQTDEATIAVTSSGAVVVLSSMVPVDKKWKRAGQKSDEVARLVELVSVTPRSKKVRLFRPIKKKVADEQLDATLWQLRGAKRTLADDSVAKGAMLVVSVPVGDREIFGFGFAAEDDTDGTKAVFESILSIQPKEPEPSPSSDSEDDSEDDTEEDVSDDDADGEEAGTQ